ncbi:MAG: OprO/OprP family phosphate-selective porin [Candidatus Methylomirabilis sp.]|nr:OprO/OprP family phosphate-selective porin [Deltaproteobacteria bacterium]
MKRKLILALAFATLGACMVSGSAAPAHAGFVFGDETKGVKLSQNESDMTIRLRLQPRLDFGDTIKSKDGSSYASQSDLYLRRVRLELGGSLLAKTLTYNVTLTADKWDKAGNSNEVGIQYAYLKWNADDALTLTAGKEKLPFSRVSLVSSSKQLVIERPVSTEAAKKVFGKTDAYYQPKLAASGKLVEGIFAYEVAVADGWQNGEAVQTGRTVFKAAPLYAARVELSPPGWVEKSKSDAHLGKGQHLTLGANIVNQDGIEYKENGFEEDRTLLGFDISGHLNGLTAQFEYNAWEVDSSDPAVGATKPRGWYAQAGYFIDGPNIEPVARYEVYDQDSNAADKEEKITTLGVNWYGKGHSLKVGANWVRHEFDKNASGKLTNADSKDLFQVQAQMYF